MGKAVYNKMSEVTVDVTCFPGKGKVHPFPFMFYGHVVPGSFERMSEE